MAGFGTYVKVDGTGLLMNWAVREREDLLCLLSIHFESHSWMSSCVLREGTVNSTGGGGEVGSSLHVASGRLKTDL